MIVCIGVEDHRAQFVYPWPCMALMVRPWPRPWPRGSILGLGLEGPGLGLGLGLEGPGLGLGLGLECPGLGLGLDGPGLGLGLGLQILALTTTLQK